MGHHGRVLAMDRALLPAAELGEGPGSGPNPRHLADVATWSVKRLVSVDQAKLAALPPRLRLGIACSGNDCPVVVLRHLAAALQQCVGKELEIEHVFSCESDPRKREFIKANFPDLPILFDDVRKLGVGKAMNVMSGAEEAVPQCDVFFAGIQGIGDTGATWQGVFNYIAFAKPSLVLCESRCLTVRIAGAEPQIEPAMRDLRAVGYSASWRLLDSRNFHLPHRRHRCWVWGFRNAVQGVAETLMPNTLQALALPHHHSFDSIFGCDWDTHGNRHLSDRQLDVVEDVYRKRRKTGTAWGEDLFINVAGRPAIYQTCVGACPGLAQHSRPFRTLAGKILGPLEVLGLQGIWQEDYPDLERLAKDDPNLLRDIAGTACTATAALAVGLAAFVHAF